MNAYDSQRNRHLTIGIWLVGLGFLLAARRIWPGILFVGGAVALVQAYYDPERRNAGRAGIAMILLGLWAMLSFSAPVLFVGLGVWMIFSAIAASTATRKPFVDQTLD
ncbi:hypothetical protein [Paludisphaera mucosa]|uniref:DUF4190 domain-containing protein n=1 Tax=Paludisphaera mucosa TaxID=3030827 RepID=A0ABT6F695_9BACT|nr:hypothetical protein [Paludisphaera mucosa]MDG3003113.1 hypothetical protein [Paludisphaera mucosa]